MKAILDYGFDVVQQPSVGAFMDPANTASAHAAEGKYFVEKSHFKENEFWNSTFMDTVFYSLLQTGRS